MLRLPPFVAVALFLLAHVASAQDVGAAEDTVAPQTAVITPRHDIRVLIGLTAATALVMPFDARIQGRFQSNASQQSSTLKATAHLFNTVGGAGTVIAPIALYGIGRISGSPELTQLGVHSGEAVIAGGIVAKALKTAIGRQRPNVKFHDADDFSPSHGLRDNHASLPSGHTTAAFAFATVVSEDLRAWHPTMARYGIPLLYGGATLVGLSRMYANQHWASDVLLGAGLGTMVGYKTVTFSHAHPHNWVAQHTHSLHVTRDVATSRLLVGIDL